MKDSLKKFFSVAHLNGDNKYFCEKCKKKVEAKKSYVIDKSKLSTFTLRP